ncbi:PH domain-containing protein [Halobellus captivus]|uniref:PH domain-containing protein n=1 Tax=Halobellus captivus TaxID=2592614 RepID=UPI00119DA57E|nr:PH domain-containing protein [Halobellus captivus]
MSIKQHLLNDEEMLSYCTTDYWAWVCTDRRVLKYRQGGGGGEQLHDVSFGDISGISLTNQGRNANYLVGGLLAAVVGLILGDIVGPVALIAGLLIGAYLAKRWYDSESSYFEFKGTGLIRQEPEQWRIQQGAADDPDEIREFVKTVRERL